MERLILRWVINAAALYLAVGTGWISGIHAENTTGWAIMAMALVFTVVNVLLRPLLKILTCPLILLTLGLFTLVINTFLLWLTGLIGNLFSGGFGFTIDNIGWAFLGALVVSVVNTVLTLLFREELKPRKR
ncbi:MAG: phage holin family protein [Anaerolineales bacterium]|nr:MAG: phage holin family protein [Anaerolineales bacterium]